MPSHPLRHLNQKYRNLLNPCPIGGQFLAAKILSGITVSDADSTNAMEYLLEELKIKPVSIVLIVIGFFNVVNKVFKN